MSSDEDGAGEDGAGEDDDDDEDEEDDEDDDGEVVEWPWKLLAAATDTTAEPATAPAIIHRLIREISARPASRAFAPERAMMISVSTAFARTR